MTSSAVTIAGTGCVCAAGNSSAQAFAGAFGEAGRFLLPTQRVNSSYAKSFPVFQVDERVVEACPQGHSMSLHFFLTAAREAFAQAGVLPQEFLHKRVGVIVGTTVDASFHCLEVYGRWRKEQLTSQDVQELSDYYHTSTAQTVSRLFGFTGPFQTVVTACASGTDAIGLAKGWIDSGLCDVVLCGGCDEINIVPYDGFIRLLIASKEKCRPFSKNRNGINIGEGAGALLLVSQQVRQEFHIHPQGYVLGYGNACDAYHPTAPDPAAKGLSKAIEHALRQAGIGAAELAFINAHATASQANDLAESVAFRQYLAQVPVWGSKGVTGHTLGAAGAVEAVLTLQALNKRQVPPTVGFEIYDESIGFSPTTQVTTITKRVALSNSLAFGGCNAALVLGAQDYAY